MKSKNRAADAKRRRDDNLLIARMGEVAGRLHRSCVKDPKDPPLVERALQAAAEVEQRLVAQSHRIAYLEALSVTDELTGLLNRRGFEEAFRRSLVASGRYGDEGVLIVCDLDDFKTVNDRYGHFAGDAVLRQAGQLLRTQIRDTDFVARLGGDEFAVVLPGVRERHHAERVADKILAAAHAPFEVGAFTLQIGASIGVAFNADYGGTGWQSLVEHADKKLYQAKAAGRGRRG
jgi:diguanylate cyclase (GGDEF)-like protein